MSKIIQRIWYFVFTRYLKLCLYLFYKKITIKGTSNIPKGVPVIFLPNHENAFLDALLIAVSNGRFTHYLTRGDVFAKPLVVKLLATLNIRPIYRMRDGKDALAKNEKVFSDCIKYLSKKQAVMIFPEGTHQLKAQLRNISKGFTRIVFQALEKHPDMDIALVPMGINYQSHSGFQTNVSLHYGKPIMGRDYFNPEKEKENTLALKNRVQDEIKKLVVHINSDVYEEHHKKLIDAHADFSNVEQCDELIARLDEGKDLKPLKVRKPNWIEKILFPIVALNNWVCMLIWKKVKPIFKDPAFLGSVKVSVGLFVGFPVYVIQSLGVYLLFDVVWAFVYFLFSVVSLPVLRVSQKEHVHE